MSKEQRIYILLLPVLGFLIGYSFRYLEEPTNPGPRIVYTVSNDRVEVDNLLHPGEEDHFFSTAGRYGCVLDIYGGTLTEVPEPLRPHLSDLCASNRTDLWFRDDGSLFIRILMIPVYNTFYWDQYYVEGRDLYADLRDAGLVESYSFEGNYTNDSVSFDPGWPITDAAGATYSSYKYIRALWVRVSQ